MSKKILLINFGGIGDEILFLPVVSALKSKFSDCEITLCTEPRAKCVKSLSKDIDYIITADIKGKHKYFELVKLYFKMLFGGYDAVFSSGSNKLIPILLFLSGIKKRVGFSNGSFSDKLLTRAVRLDKNRYAAKMYFELVKDETGAAFKNPKIEADKLSGLDDCVLIHPGVSLMSIKKGIYKNVNPSILQTVILELLRNNKRVVLAGGPDDAEIISKILKNEEIGNNPLFLDYYGKTKNIFDLATLFNSVKLIFCCDSAPFHIAAALNKNTVVFFGPTDENKLVPANENITILTSKCDCRPCLWDKRQVNCNDNFCLNISAEEILAEINRF